MDRTWNNLMGLGTDENKKCTKDISNFNVQGMYRKKLLVLANQI